MRGLLVVVVVLFSLCTFARVASAHQVGLSRGEYVLTGGQLDIDVGFAHRELAAALPSLDADGDGQLTADELERGSAVVDRDIIERIVVRSGGRRCSIERRRVSIEGEDAVLAARATCPGGARDLELDFGFLAMFAAGHRHLVHLSAGAADREIVAVHASPSLRVVLEKALPKPVASFPATLATLGRAAAVLAIAVALLVVSRRRARRRKPTPLEAQ